MTARWRFSTDAEGQTTVEVAFTDGSRMKCEDTPFAQGGVGGIHWSEGKTHVIKFYLPGKIADLGRKRQELEAITGKFNLVGKDSYWQELFGWPDAIVASVNGRPQLGLRMPAVKGYGLENFILPKSRSIIERGLSPKLKPEVLGSYNNHVTIAVRLARVVRRMHGRGLCHSDLSPKNVMVDPRDGRTALIDCDGIVVPGILPADVLGTPKYIAPELVAAQGTANQLLPSVNTDKHALAVLIYQTLLFRHPLDGPKIHSRDAEEDEKLAFGSKALYIEHPTDHSNRPAKLPFSSAMLTRQLQELMQKAFVEGLHDLAKRPAAAQWESALVRMADRLIPCPSPKCPMKAFILPETGQVRCPWCGTPVTNPPVLPLLWLFRHRKAGAYQPDDWCIVGWPQRILHNWHANIRLSPGPDCPQDKLAHFEWDHIHGKWYLANDALPEARCITTSGAQDFSPGKRVELVEGLRFLLSNGEDARAAMVQMIRP